MYVKWKDIEEEVLEESGVTKEELDKYLAAIYSDVANMAHFWFDLFTMGTINFKLSFMRKLLKEDSERSLPAMKAIAKYYAKYTKANLSDIIVESAKKYKVEIAPRVKKVVKLKELFGQ